MGTDENRAAYKRQQSKGSHARGDSAGTTFNFDEVKHLVVALRDVRRLGAMHLAYPAFNVLIQRDSYIAAERKILALHGRMVSRREAAHRPA